MDLAAVAQQWQHESTSINKMAKYGEPSEVKISTNNPRPLKPWVYAVAAAVGLMGGILGLAGAPFALWAINKNGPVVIGKKTVGIWAQWIAAGVVISPILLAISAIRPPQTTTTRQLSADEVTLDLVLSKSKETTFTPGVVGRNNSETCQTTSKSCQQWTALAVGCEANLKRRFEGFNGKFLQDYCGKAEDLRERVTGVELSTAPNAFSF